MSDHKEQIDSRITCDYLLARDHEEALRLHRQMQVVGDGITVQDVIDLNRFCECCLNDERYDVPKERMRELKLAGLVSGGRFGFYTTTAEGERIWRAR